MFSIIVPVYNVEKYLDQCLESILRQSFKDFECIIIDDGSPDNSNIIIDKYVKLDQRFKVIYQKNRVCPKSCGMRSNVCVVGLQ